MLRGGFYSCGEVAIEPDKGFKGMPSTMNMQPQTLPFNDFERAFMQFYLLYMFGGPSPDRSLDARGTNVPGIKKTHPPSDDRDTWWTFSGHVERQVCSEHARATDGTSLPIGFGTE